MAKKNLLNESQIKRFQSLASIAPLAPIHEMYSMKNEDAHEEEKEELALDVDAEELPMEEPEMAVEELPMEEPEMEMGAVEGDVDLEQSDVETLLAAFDAAMDVVEKLRGALDGGEVVDEPELEEPEPMTEPEVELDAEMEDDGELKLEAKTDLVAEVARRVAKRLTEAKEAKAALDKALGNK